MSRSYKRYNVCKDKNNKLAKKTANKKTRKSKDTIQRCGYKKLFCSWDISEWSNIMTFAEYIERFGNSSKTLKELYREYYKKYRSK